MAVLPAFETLIDICTDKDASKRDRINAANSLLDRGGFGTKATLVHEHEENSESLDNLSKEDILARIDRLRQRVAERNTAADYAGWIVDPDPDESTSDGPKTH